MTTDAGMMALAREAVAQYRSMSGKVIYSGEHAASILERWLDRIAASQPDRRPVERCDYCKEHGFQHPNLCEDCRAASQPDREAVALGDTVRVNSSFPYFHEWERAEMKVVGLHLAPDGDVWADVIEGEQRHRGNGVYDGETTDFNTRWLTKVSSDSLLSVQVDGEQKETHATKPSPSSTSATATETALRKQLQYCVDNIQGIMDGDDAPSSIILRRSREALALPSSPAVAETDADAPGDAGLVSGGPA